MDDCVLVADVTHAHGKYSDAYLWYDYCQASAYIDPRLQAEIKTRKEALEAEVSGKHVGL